MDTTLVSIVKAIRVADMTAVVTIYLSPMKNAIDEITNATSGLLKTLVDVGVQAVEYDLEGGWSESTVCGFRSHQEAVAYLVQRSKSVSAELPVGITTHLGRAGDRNLALHEADWVSIQAYSKCERPKCPAFDDKEHGPGHRQRLVAIALASFKKPVVIGLAAYHQKWPART